MKELPKEEQQRREDSRVRYPVRARYEQDPFFHQLVDMLHSQIVEARFTPTEIREAAMLAQIMYEELNPNPRPVYFTRDDVIKEKA